MRYRDLLVFFLTIAMSLIATFASIRFVIKTGSNGLSVHVVLTCIVAATVAWSVAWQSRWFFAVLLAGVAGGLMLGGMTSPLGVILGMCIGTAVVGFVFACHQGKRLASSRKRHQQDIDNRGI